MSLENTLRDLQQQLREPAAPRLNEAQTVQVVVLRLLQALGWDIWNPAAVCAQRNSGGGSGAYVPDFLLLVEGKARLVVEAKALGARFSANEATQALNYAVKHAVRWAVLTDGRTWHFYDKNLTIHSPPEECLQVTIDLLDPDAKAYLERLLAHKVWRDPKADERVAAEAERVQASIRKRQSLTDIKNKLAAALTQAYKATPEGLDRAIRNELDPSEQQLAFEYLAQLHGSLLKAGEPEEGQPRPLGAGPTDPVTTLHQAFKDYVKPGNDKGVAATLQGSQLAVRNWRDLLHGVAQAFVLLGRGDELRRTNRVYVSVDELRKQNSGEPYLPSAYRELSNGKVFFVHGGADESRQLLEELLTQLGVPQGVLEVEYKGKSHKLPSGAATASRR
ncbi:hypothetical protein Mterra_00627 [Calidithermus terrae]|uniref:MmeI-like N-terminal domain-containing protein n=1 Tax=Calidithermus terrae TaxID=1408545 RepID=A0A399F6L1_9DEIN|nr:type IIL restriction-modification enzyme MmeI [Calidithermus terrae]RIH90251.1 hypothetical protein Mterra_00627 [Calidithermus terrae]